MDSKPAHQYQNNQTNQHYYKKNYHQRGRGGKPYYNNYRGGQGAKQGYQQRNQYRPKEMMNPYVLQEMTAEQIILLLPSLTSFSRICR